jgi:hypothetical protein
MSIYSGRADVPMHVVLDNSRVRIEGGEEVIRAVESFTYALYAVSIAVVAGVIVLAIR